MPHENLFNSHRIILVSITESLLFAGPLIGGLSGSRAAKRAASDQAAAASEATAENRRQFDVSRGDLLAQLAQSRANIAPYQTAGKGALTKLTDLLGIDSYGGDSGTQPEIDSLTSQISSLSSENRSATPISEAVRGALTNQLNTAQARLSRIQDQHGGTGYRNFGELDEALKGVSDIQGQIDALGGSAAIDNSSQIPPLQARLDSLRALQTTPNARSSEYGSLLKDYEKPFTPFKKFTLDDFIKEPGYDFRLAEGEKSINRAALAGGRYDSGGTLKDLLRYGQDYASGEYGNAYGRFNSDQSANHGFELDDYNRFNTNKTSKFNFLSNLAGTGQNAVNSINNQGSNTFSNLATLSRDFSNTNAELLASGANARAAGRIGSANALNTGISGAFNNFQNQELLKRLPVLSQV